MRRRRRLQAVFGLLVLLSTMLGVGGLNPTSAGAVPVAKGWLNIPNGDALAGGSGGIFQQFPTVSVSGSGGATGTHTISMSGSGRSFSVVFASKSAGGGVNQLQVGTYDNAVKSPSTSEHRLEISGNGVTCSATFGRFIIDDIAFSGGQISRLALIVEQRCNSGAPSQPVTTGLFWIGEPGPLNAGSLPTSEFLPLSPPQRVLDTREGIGIGRTVAVGPGETVSNIPVTGCAGCPPTGQTTAVVMNVTAAGGSAASFLTVWPAGTGQPGVSNVNFRPGENRPNLAVVKVSGDGKVNLYNDQGSAHVIFDVIGYFAPDAAVSGGRFHPITPTRLLDTRDTNNPLQSGVPRALAIPGSGVTGAVMNVTAVGAQGGGFVTVYPGNLGTPPGTSNLNFSTNQTVPNLVFSGVSGGNVNLYAFGADVHIIVDLVGYFDVNDSSTAGRFVPIAPVRKMDTRNAPFTALRARGVQDFGLAGQLTLYPFEISGAILNATAASPTELTFVTVYPKQDASHPGVSNLNVDAGEDRPNLVAVGTSDFGFISIYNEQGNVHVILDVAGWFTA